MKKINELLPIELYKRPVYKKCESCGRVQNIFYHVTILDAATGDSIVGSLDLCRDCGNNLAKIIADASGTPDISEGRVIQEFNFSDLPGNN